MKITFESKSSIGYLNIISDNATIKEDVVVIGKNKQWEVPDSEIEQLIKVANDMHGFNNKSDVDFVKMIIDTYLNDSELEELIDLINPSSLQPPSTNH